MTTTIEVIYEQGILRPLGPLDWQEGEQHTLTVQDDAPPVTVPADPPDPQRAAQILAEIAAMSMQSDGESFSGRDHDRILYGGPEGAR